MMINHRTLAKFAIVAVSAATLSACASGSGASTATPTDLLDDVRTRGELVVVSDPAFPPLSYYDESSQTWEGYDVDVAAAIADGLGVEVKFVAAPWDLVTAGSWQGRFDLSVGSMTPLEERLESLYFSEPYWYQATSIAVAEDSPIDALDELGGATIGACTGCAESQYLDRTLTFPGLEFEWLVPQDITVKQYDDTATIMADVSIGRLDAGIAATTNFLAGQEAGEDIRILEPALFSLPQCVAADRSSSLSSESLIAEVDEILQELRDDGTLEQLSEEWFGINLTEPVTKSNVD